MRFLGDLEQTLHREFVMASRLKGMLECSSFVEPLEEFGDVVKDFLQQHIPSQVQQTWQTTHSDSPTTVHASVYEALGSWSNARSTRGFPRSLFICTKITYGNVVYTPYTSSNGNGCVVFSGPTLSPTLLPGRIEFILKEPENLVTGKPRIILLVRAFRPLANEDSLHDPYFNHPIIGARGASIARLYYDELETDTHLIEPRDLVSHVAVCPYVDPEGTLAQSAIVVLSLDLVSLELRQILIFL
jgi:hypothetical protein